MLLGKGAAVLPSCFMVRSGGEICFFLMCSSVQHSVLGARFLVISARCRFRLCSSLLCTKTVFSYNRISFMLVVNRYGYFLFRLGHFLRLFFQTNAIVSLFSEKEILFYKKTSGSNTRMSLFNLTYSFILQSIDQNKAVPPLKYAGSPSSCFFANSSKINTT